MLQARHFIFKNSLLEIAAKALTGSGEFRTAGKPLRARVKEGKVLTVPSNSRQYRSGAGLNGGPCLHEHTTTLPARVASLPASERPGGIFRLAGYMLERLRTLVAG